MAHAIELLNELELANSWEASQFVAPYPELTPEYWQVKGLFERSGLNVVDGAVTKTANVITSTGESVTASTIATTEITTDVVAGTTTITASPLPEITSGGSTIVKAGATVNWLNALAYVGAVAQGVQIGLKSYNEYPEFWTELSNRVFGNPQTLAELREPTPANLMFAGMFLTRVLEDGGVRTYCDKKRAEKIAEEIKNSMYGDVTKNHDTSGSYLITAKGFTSKEDAVAILQALGVDYPSKTGAPSMRDAICNYGLTNQELIDRGANGLQIILSTDSNENLKVARLYYYRIVNNTPYTITVTDSKTTMNISPIYEYRVRGTLNPNKWETTVYGGGGSAFGNYIKGGDSADTGFVSVAYSDIDGTTTLPNNQAIITDETSPVTKEEFERLLNAWLSSVAFSTNGLNEDGTVNQTDWIPLSLKEPDPDGNYQPNPNAKNGDVPTPDGKIPPYTNEKFLPPTTTPDLPSPYDESNKGSTPIPTVPSNSGSAKLYTVYHPSETQLNDLGSYLWTNNIVTEIVKMFTNNPMDAIISLHQVYCTPSDGSSKHIMLGSLDSNVSAPVVTNQYVSINCGTVFVPEVYNDARDYINTQAEIYLPFIGFRSIDIHDVVNCSVAVKYTIDLYTGSCLAQLDITKDNVKQTLYTFEGNCSVQIPLTASQRTGIVGLIGSMASTVVGGAVGGVGGAIAGATAGAIKTASTGGFQANIQRTSGFSGNAGAMAIKKPYIIITRMKSADASQYNEIIGNPTNKTTYLCNCTGFTRVKDIHLDNVNATDTEKSMIENALKQGVII